MSEILALVVLIASIICKKRQSVSSSRFQINLGLLKQILILQSTFLLLLTTFRLFLFIAFAPSFDSNMINEIIAAFWLGFRIDTVLVSYFMALPLLIVVFNHLLRNFLSLKLLQMIFTGYFIVIYLLVSLIVGMDFGFYSYFNEHITIMIYGIMDDDTWALLSIAQKNYNLYLIALVSILYALGLMWCVKQILFAAKESRIVVKGWQQPFVYLLFVGLVFVGARGSIGLFPLLKDIPDVSGDPFINSLPINGVFAFQKASEQYARNKSGSYDLVKTVGYKNHEQQAFRDFLGRDDINTTDLFSNLEHTTDTNLLLEQHPPHVVVVMIESFGTPILKYQSEQFDILRSLKKHFDKDTLFNNFISTANGTIVSMEPLLLNLTARPGSTSYGQSEYLGVAFSQAAAGVYQKAGYETHFVYGGDLSWRNVGSFFKRQGFDSVAGKSSIKKAFPDSVEHDWGVYDKYSYKYVLKQLKEATKPQFIFLLTTNNHPPYILDPAYHSKPLVISKALKSHITGNLELIKQRLKDYQYALDMAGKFMDEIKASDLAGKSVITITADNNTIEGVMHYDNFLQESKQIPFYLYLPPYLRNTKVDMTTPGSHKDIFPTLYNQTLSNVTYSAIGTNLFNSNILHCGFNDKHIVISREGAFKVPMKKDDALNACQKQYKAALAVGEVWIKSQK